MATVNVEENIKQIQGNIERMTQEVFRLQGMLETFKGFRDGGVETINMPNNPNNQPVKRPVEELESVQEKPE
jgi:hypothetical protein